MRPGVRHYSSPEALAKRLGCTVAEVEARAIPWRERGARAVLVVGVGWVAITDDEAPLIGMPVLPPRAPMFTQGYFGRPDLSGDERTRSRQRERNQREGRKHAAAMRCAGQLEK